MGNKRSLTIVELLIVIALLAAMASIIIPLIGDSLNERAFESAADVTGEQLVLARAHAQSTGEPVEVRYHVSSAQVEARMFAPWAPGFEPWSALNPVSAAASSGSKSRGDSAKAMESDIDSRDFTITEPWANRALSSGIRIVNHRPVSAVSEEQAGGVLAQLGLPGDSDSDIRLAVFMPDGSALMGAPVWLNDDDGRIGKLTINPWTGLPMFERVTTSDEEDASSATIQKSDDDRTDSANTKGKSRTKASLADREKSGDSTKRRH